MTLQVTRLNLSAVLEAQQTPQEPLEQAKTSNDFISLHLSEVQAEQAPAEGVTIITPRSRPNSARNTPRADSSSPARKSSSPRTPTSGRASNIDRMTACPECGRFEHSPINGACSWRCMVKVRLRGKDEASSSDTESEHV